MTPLFIILAGVTVGSALAAICLRNLVHCALCFATSLLGMAGIFLWLGVQFIGFAQVLVYVGAISILVVFAILLTRGTVEGSERFYGSILVGGAVALLLGGILFTSVLMNGDTQTTPLAKAQLSKISTNPGAVVLTKAPASDAEALAHLDNATYLVYPTSGASTTVRQIGEKLMTTHVLALEIIALVLTVALLGAVTLAMPERKRP
jgi:NADH-quinone oxidoreductase subunit J